ncbi:MAG TPA: putative metal-dependent hydrolase [Candidatus Acidoferrales bacterium]|nr:putative metal-dependent hydrolase [Candidatus Acidoferrales bacterium]
MDADLRYPIGKLALTKNPTDEQRRAMIYAIAETPANLAAALQGLNGPQLDTPYRPGGWTVRQVAHHLPDSHMNAFVRFKLALTEDQPTIKPYKEALWAETPDGKSAPVEPSLRLLEYLHERWVLLLRSMAPTDWPRTLVHPERGPMTLDETLGIYAWHGRHHTAHITALRAREGWK